MLLIMYGAFDTADGQKLPPRFDQVEMERHVRLQRLARYTSTRERGRRRI